MNFFFKSVSVATFSDQFIDFVVLNSTFYPTTYDVAKKRKSKMYPYIGLAVELARQEELDSAADVMIKTCEVVVSSKCAPLYYNERSNLVG